MTPRGVKPPWCDVNQSGCLAEEGWGLLPMVLPVLRVRPLCGFLSHLSPGGGAAAGSAGLWPRPPTEAPRLTSSHTGSSRNPALPVPLRTAPLPSPLPFPLPAPHHPPFHPPMCPAQVDFDPNGPKRPPLAIPPHTSGFGSEEDSLQVGADGSGRGSGWHWVKVVAGTSSN